QIFSGAVAGDAFLMLDVEAASILSGLLGNMPDAPKRFDASAREVLLEVGNILLNACLGMFGNLLKVHVSFSVPRLHLEEFNSMMTTLTIGKEGIRYALVMTTSFSLKNQAVSGYLVMVLGVDSLDRLIKSVDEWAKIGNSNL
ncbi:MAG: chemotaxis protein CheC, partial [Thermodesulfobacteriota bacterium]